VTFVSGAFRPTLWMCCSALLLSACGGGGQVPVAAVPAPAFAPAPLTGKKLLALNDTGITSKQCFQEGSDSLVSCTSAGAVALNALQDGMFGRDVEALTAGAADGQLGFSYTKVSSSGDELPANAASWACVLDNVTGLLWESKTTDGSLRDASRVFTNFDASGTPQIRGGGIPTLQEVDAAGNTQGYVRVTNAQGLCGFKDWALPTDEQLQSLVAYSEVLDAPTVDSTWFPNTRRTLYWSSTPTIDTSDRAWGIDFGDGLIYPEFKYVARPARLVR
jgi:Protein of unknown function (DUF1566)